MRMVLGEAHLFLRLLRKGVAAEKETIQVCVRKMTVMVGSFSLNCSSEVSLPGQALDGLGYGHQLAVRQHLSDERGAVGLSQGQDAACHGTSFTGGRTTRAVARRRERILPSGHCREG